MEKRCESCRYFKKNHFLNFDGLCVLVDKHRSFKKKDNSCVHWSEREDKNGRK